jgi:hypothetical protein
MASEKRFLPGTNLCTPISHRFYLSVALCKYLSPEGSQNQGFPTCLAVVRANFG